MADKSRLFRAAKARVFKRVMEPVGFIKGSKLYVRQTDGQVHGIEFQTSTRGGRYFVNVCFSYDFLPGFMALGQYRKNTLPEFIVLDFLARIRLENLMPEGYPSEWSYGADVSDMEVNLDLNARNAIAAINAFGGKWRDPLAFMKALPPELLDQDLKELEIRADISSHTPLPPLPVASVLGRGWTTNRWNLCYGLATIALRSGQIYLLEEYLKIAQKHSQGVFHERPLKVLRMQLKSGGQEHRK